MASPVVTIVNIAATGGYVLLGFPSYFSATATDAEDGDISANIEWVSNVDGSLGIGPVPDLSLLVTLGAHTITASVEDSNFNGGNDVVVVTLIEVIPTGPVDDFLGSSLDAQWGTEGAGTVGVTVSGGSVNFSHSNPASGSRFLRSPPINDPSTTDFSIPGAGISFELGIENVTSGNPEQALELWWELLYEEPGYVEYDNLVLVEFRSAGGYIVELQIVVDWWGAGDTSEESIVSIDYRDYPFWYLIYVGENRWALYYSVNGVTWLFSQSTALATPAAEEVSTKWKSRLTGGTGTLRLAAVNVLPEPPAVVITSPPTGTIIVFGSAGSFTGTATDEEDGDISANTEWESDVDGPLGTGASIPYSALTTLGSHTITASVVDSDDLPASDSIDVVLIEDDDEGGGGGSARPCALELTVYESDNVTPEWQVVTDAAYLGEGAALPYLLEPTSYGEQEVDFAEGRASIGQVNVAVIDPRQLPNDQDSGWMTERLIDVAGRRNRLRRWISEAAGWVTIADGPGSFPRLRPSFAGYEWSIRDTREKERRLRAFITTDTPSVLPRGVVDGFGWDGATYLIPPTTPLVGTYSTAVLGRITFPTLTDPIPPERIVNTAQLNAMALELDPGSPAFGIYTYRFPNVVVLWRDEGSADPWTELRPVLVTVIPEVSGNLADVDDGVDAAGNPVQGVLSIYLGTEVSPGFPPGFPANGQDVEVVVRYDGAVGDTYPLHIDGLTAGELLVNLYDGIYSPRDSLDAIIPTGVRYDEDALMAVTTPVRLRITEPVDDVRGWAEEHIYKPLGYAPAFDSDGLISPVSQIPPASLRSSDVIDNSITAPVPGHTPGDNVINVLKFTYPRAYPRLGSEAVDALDVRDVYREFRNEPSIERFGPQEWEVETNAFVGIGDEGGVALEVETGFALAEARDTHLADRRAYGTDLVVVPVMRVPTSHMRAGGWVRVLLSWIPNHLTGRRSLDHLGQIAAIKDLNCAWREMTIELVAGWGDTDRYDYESLGHVENPDEPGALFLVELEALPPSEEGSAVVQIRARANDDPDDYRLKLFARRLPGPGHLGTDWYEISTQVTPFAFILPTVTQEYLWETEWAFDSGATDSIDLEVRGDIVKVSTGVAVYTGTPWAVSWNTEL